MKSPFAMACGWLSLVALPAAAVAQQGHLAPVDGKTAALYQFSEGDGTSTADGSGNGHAGTLEGAVSPVWVAGQSGSALDFAGDGSVVTVAPTIDVGAEWTIQGWTSFPLDPNPSSWKYFVTSGNTGGFFAHVAVTGDKLGTWTGTWNGSGFDVTTVSPGWHLLSAVGSGGQTLFYIDATPVGISAGQVTNPVKWIGGVGGSVWSWGGAIDSLRILSVARTAAEIEVDFNGVPVPPAAPGSPGQFSLDDAPVPPGGAVVDAFTVKATVGGYAAVHHLEVEVKPVGVAFDGSTGLYAGADVPAGPASVTVGGAGLGPRHWWVRTVDAVGSSPWVAFGADPNGTDVVLLDNSAPTAGPAFQVSASDGSAIQPGKAVFDADPVQFEAMTADLNGDLVRLQVEVRAFGSVFLDQATAEGAPVPGGQAATCRVELSPGLYSWQSRVIDSRGAASAWTPFGGPGISADLSVKAAGSFGGDGCAGSASGTGDVMGWAWLLLVAAALRIAVDRWKRLDLSGVH